MTIWEYQAAKKYLPLQKKFLRGISRRTPSYTVELSKYLNLLITVKGHAWCMDVKSERSKMANLIAKSIKELSVV